MAVSYGGQWLHAHPTLGVILSARLSDVSLTQFEIWDNPGISEPSPQWVKRELKKSYDPFFRWKDSATTYCSKLVGRFLGIAPTVMQFEGSFWHSPYPPKWANRPYPTGTKGLSPDEIAHWIHKQAQLGGWRRLTTETSCIEQLR